MTLAKCIATLISFLSISLAATPLHSQEYDVVPVDLGHGYSIQEGSTITVDSGEIVDWNVTVSGEFPHTFRPSTDSRDSARVSDALVANGQITIELGLDPTVYFGFREEYDCEAEFCVASLYWAAATNLETQSLVFTHHGWISGGGNNPDIPDEGDFLFAARPEPGMRLPKGRTVLATVPEPTSWMLLNIAVLALAFTRKRRRSSNAGSYTGV